MNLYNLLFAVDSRLILELSTEQEVLIPRQVTTPEDKLGIIRDSNIRLS